MPARKKTRKDGRYEATLTLGISDEGKIIRKHFYGKTQKEANAKKQDYLNGTKPTEITTIGQWCDKWLAAYASGGYRNKLNTASIINRFKDFIGHKMIVDVKPADLQEYAKTQAEFSKSHVDKVRRTLTNLFSAAIDNGYLVTSPMRGIIWEYVRTGTHKVVPPEIVKLITDYWKIHPAGIWAMFMLYAGLRPSEAFALRRENISDTFIEITDGSHFEHNKLVITEGDPKSEAGIRSVPVLPVLAHVFRALPEEGLVCLGATGKPVTEAAVRSGWRCLWNMLEELYNGRIPHKSGRRSDKYPEDWKHLPDIQMYDLRHTYCSMLYDADVDVKTAQYLMGHATLEMTLKIYTHLSEQKKQRSYEKLYRYFGVTSSEKSSETPKPPENTAY